MICNNRSKLWMLGLGNPKLLLLVLLLSLHSLTSANTNVALSQVSSLLSLKSMLDFNFAILNSWDEYKKCSSWIGLTCDENGFVIEINLRSDATRLPATNYEDAGYETEPARTLGLKRLYGTISESVGNLTKLKRLMISGNFLSNEIPSSIGELVNLEVLDLSDNFLTGSIPSSISKLKKLRILFLSYNSLTGAIPSGLRKLTRLVSLDLSANNLNSTIPRNFSSLSNLTSLNFGSNNFQASLLPSWTLNLTKLKSLDFRGVNLNGSIPSFDTLPKLTYIDLSSNKFSGSITSQFSKLNDLTALLLSTNSITGPIPSAFGKLPLNFLDLSRNKFSGGIPSALSQLGETISILDLTSNSLNGTIPSSISNLTSLTALCFGSNQLIGTIPDSITEMSSISDIFLEGNSLTGQIPSEINKLNALTNLVLSGNQLSGPLPNNVSQLTELVALMVDNNTLSGQLPPEFENLISLEYFDASQNSFTGIIPPGYGSLNNLTNLRLFQNSFEGPIPNFSNLAKLVELDLSLNVLNGTVPDDLSPSLIKLNLRSNFLSDPVPFDLIQRLTSLTTLDLSVNLLTNVPSFKNVSNSLTFVSLASSQFTSDTPASITTSNSVIEIFGKNCATSNQSCFKAVSDYTSTPLACDSKCNGDEDFSPLLYMNPQDCPCSPPLIVEINLLAPLFFVFNFDEKKYVQKYFSDLLDIPQILIEVKSASATVGTQVMFDVFLYLFTKDKEPWLNKDVIATLGNLYASAGKLNGARLGPYLVTDYFVTEKVYNIIERPGSIADENKEENNTNATRTLILIACLTTLAIVIIIVIIAIFISNRIYGGGKKQGKLEKDVVSGMARAMTFKELQQSTNYFSKDLLLGAGGFGSVYKGVSISGQVYAVKRAKQVSLKSKTDFENEVLSISRMDHINLVKLLGYCDEQNEQILIYEFMSNGTLRDALDPKHAGVTRPVLTFDERLHIAVESASGLNYLHSGATQTIIHRDIKPENILLDANLAAKVADFGLFKKNILEETNVSQNTKLAGTPGYMDPEYYATYKVTVKNDVYSFGVVLLELLTGKAPIMEHSKTIKSKHDQDAVSMITITKWAVPYIEAGKISDIIDPMLDNDYDPKAAEALAYVACACVKKQGSQRPTMSIVVARLHEILEAMRTGIDISADYFSVSVSDTDSNILEPPIHSTSNSGVSGFYPVTVMDLGR